MFQRDQIRFKSVSMESKQNVFFFIGHVLNHWNHCGMCSLIFSFLGGPLSLLKQDGMNVRSWEEGPTSPTSTKRTSPAGCPKKAP